MCVRVYIHMYIHMHTPGHIHIRVLNKMRITQKQSSFGIWCSFLQMMTCFPIIYFYLHPNSLRFQIYAIWKYATWTHGPDDSYNCHLGHRIHWVKKSWSDCFSFKCYGKSYRTYMCVLLLVLGFCFKLDICLHVSHSYSPVLCHTSLQPTNICPILCFHDQIIFKLKSCTALVALAPPSKISYFISFSQQDHTIQLSHSIFLLPSLHQSWSVSLSNSKKNLPHSNHCHSHTANQRRIPNR